MLAGFFMPTLGVSRATSLADLMADQPADGGSADGTQRATIGQDGATDRTGTGADGGIAIAFRHVGTGTEGGDQGKR
ncbi:hypothetical protein EDWATA_02458 [Edwardsiella tarda ATCC 23685]|uniref:Uncharacterized protein n=1 Tax=Edwardsiella tarda ATCC 23685 TaxID=500638 RepID=D4F6S4_EDWTA|nr:hypothetical protein EDWATA_02458 [Edwardsiella tarda ATCC 23685]